MSALADCKLVVCKLWHGAVSADFFVDESVTTLGHLKEAAKKKFELTTCDVMDLELLELLDFSRIKEDEKDCSVDDLLFSRCTRKRELFVLGAKVSSDNDFQNKSEVVQPKDEKSKEDEDEDNYAEIVDAIAKRCKKIWPSATKDYPKQLLLNEDRQQEDLDKLGHRDKLKLLQYACYCADIRVLNELLTLYKSGAADGELDHSSWNFSRVLTAAILADRIDIFVYVLKELRIINSQVRKASNIASGLSVFNIDYNLQSSSFETDELVKCAKTAAYLGQFEFLKWMLTAEYFVAGGDVRIPGLTSMGPSLIASCVERSTAGGHLKQTKWIVNLLEQKLEQKDQLLIYCEPAFTKAVELGHFVHCQFFLSLGLIVPRTALSRVADKICKVNEINDTQGLKSLASVKKMFDFLLTNATSVVIGGLMTHLIKHTKPTFTELHKQTALNILDKLVDSNKVDIDTAYVGTSFKSSILVAALCTAKWSGMVEWAIATHSRCGRIFFRQKQLSESISLAVDQDEYKHLDPLIKKTNKQIDSIINCSLEEYDQLHSANSDSINLKFKCVEWVQQLIEFALSRYDKLSTDGIKLKWEEAKLLHANETAEVISIMAHLLRMGTLTFVNIRKLSPSHLECLKLAYSQQQKEEVEIVQLVQWFKSPDSPLLKLSDLHNLTMDYVRIAEKFRDNGMELINSYSVVD